MYCTDCESKKNLTASAAKRVQERCENCGQRMDDNRRPLNRAGMFASRPKRRPKSGSKTGRVKNAMLATMIFLLFGVCLSTASAAPVSTDDTFIFYEPITQSSVLKLTMTLEEWSEANPDKPFKLMLNSPGGDVLASFALVDELNHLRGQGHTLTIVVYGMAASAAGWILETADHRVIGANSMVLIHEVSSGTEGKLSDMKASLAFTSMLQEQFLKLLAKRSHLSLKVLHSHIDGGNDWWLTADEAKNAGLVDEIECVRPPQK